ncbi:hypothetical protein [Pseudovibrio sp. JE062]|uniref:hypothetical protein n=1 Tax=Pseudovibrio sp. JE062 TaxID=439495 RepID=UPI0012EE963B|nr:hypothetical protein [Pseudovibrio sp. JE062]
MFPSYNCPIRVSAYLQFASEFDPSDHLNSDVLVIDAPNDPRATSGIVKVGEGRLIDDHT